MTCDLCDGRAVITVYLSCGTLHGCCTHAATLIRWRKIETQRTKRKAS